MSKNVKITEPQNIPEIGLLRLKQILQFVPVSRSTWLAGVKTGRFPKPIKLGPRTTAWSSLSADVTGSWPIKLGPRTTAWRVADIHALINHGVQYRRINQNNVTKM